jgi:hypothetical protein
VLVIAVPVVIAIAAALAALIVYRPRAEQAMLAAWQARSTAARAAGCAR